MRISVIAAIGKNRELGVKNKIPWHIKEDLQRFKNLTLHKTIIVGRKTYESLIEYYQKSGRPLPERKMIIISNRTNKSNLTNLTYWTNSMESAIDLAKKIEKKEVFISGGAQIYSLGIKYTDKLYLTLVDKEYPDADAFFPDYSEFKKIVFEENNISSNIKYKFIELEK